MEFQPHLKDEITRMELTDFLIFEKKKKKNPIFLDINIKNLLKATRYMDLIFFSRVAWFQILKFHWQESQFMEKLFKKKEVYFQISFQYRIPLLIESLVISCSLIEENISLDILFLKYLLRNKNIFLYKNYMKKQFREKKNYENYKFLENLKQFDFYFGQGNYLEAKNCLSVLSEISDKETTNRVMNAEIAFRLGRMALKEKKIISAFSNFLQTFEKIPQKQRIKLEKVTECLLFCSSFLKKTRRLRLKKKEPLLENKLNFVLVKFLGNSLKKKNLPAIQIGLINKWHFCNLVIRNFLTKFHFIYFKKIFKEITKTYCKIHLSQLSGMFGIAEKVLEILISKMIIRGRIRGVLDNKTKSFISIRNQFDKFPIKNLMIISVKLNTTLSINLRKYLI